MCKKIMFSLLLVCVIMNVWAGGISDSLAVMKNVAHYEFVNSNGENVNLGMYKGRSVYIEIWSLSCVPCMHEMSYFHRLATKMEKEAVDFISICVENNHPLWQATLKKREIHGKQWRTSILSPFLKENGFIAVPRFVLIDPDGNIKCNNAIRPSDPEAERLIRAALEEGVN